MLNENYSPFVNLVWLLGIVAIILAFGRLIFAEFRRRFVVRVGYLKAKNIDEPYGGAVNVAEIGKIFWMSSEYAGTLLLWQFVEEDGPFLTKDVVDRLAQPFKEDHRPIVRVWLLIYSMWLFRRLLIKCAGPSTAREAFANLLGRMMMMDDQFKGASGAAGAIHAIMNRLDHTASLITQLSLPPAAKGLHGPSVETGIAIALLSSDRNSPFYASSKAFAQSAMKQMTEGVDLSEVRAPLDFEGADTLLADALRQVGELVQTPVECAVKETKKRPVQ